MTITAAQDLLHHLTLIGQKQKTLGILIEASDRIDTLRIIDIVDHVDNLLSVLGVCCCTDNSTRFIKREKNLFLLLVNRLAVNGHTLTVLDLLTGKCRNAVNADPALF